MFKNITAPSIVLFSVIPLRFLIEWTPMLGIPYLSTICVLVEYVAILKCLLVISSIPGAMHFNRVTKLSIAVFILYSMYLIYDIVISPQIPREYMVHTPETNLSLFQSIVSFCVLFFIVNLFTIKFNYTRWAKVSCLFLTVMLIIYVLKVDISYYALNYVFDPVTHESVYSLSDMRMFDSLRLGWFCGIAYVCNLFLKNKWSDRPIVRNVLFWGISVLTISICISTIQRGPIIFIISTTLFYYFAKGYISHRYLGWIAFFCFLLMIFSDSILDIFFGIAPEVMSRFGDIAEGGSGRYGSEDSAYALALKEFLISPIWGHYFRYSTVQGYFYGHYPHNIFLESLMTMGILGSVPFFYVLYRCVKNTYYAIRDDAPIAVIGLIFIYIFSTLVTSTTMVLLGNFWIPLVIISTYVPNKNKS